MTYLTKMKWLLAMLVIGSAAIMFATVFSTVLIYQEYGFITIGIMPHWSNSFYLGFMLRYIAIFLHKKIKQN